MNRQFVTRSGEQDYDVIVRFYRGGQEISDPRREIDQAFLPSIQHQADLMIQEINPLIQDRAVVNLRLGRRPTADVSVDGTQKKVANSQVVKTASKIHDYMTRGASKFVTQCRVSSERDRSDSVSNSETGSSSSSSNRSGGSAAHFQDRAGSFAGSIKGEPIAFESTNGHDVAASEDCATPFTMAGSSEEKSSGDGPALQTTPRKSHQEISHTGRHKSQLRDFRFRRRLRRQRNAQDSPSPSVRSASSEYDLEGIDFDTLKTPDTTTYTFNFLGINPDHGSFNYKQLRKLIIDHRSRERLDLCNIRSQAETVGLSAESIKTDEDRIAGFVSEVFEQVLKDSSRLNHQQSSFWEWFKVEIVKNSKSKKRLIATRTKVITEVEKFLGKGQKAAQLANHILP